jgi:hypothetical protein
LTYQNFLEKLAGKNQNILATVLRLDAQRIKYSGKTAGEWAVGELYNKPRR